MQLGDEHSFSFLIHDRDTKFNHAFDEIWLTEGIKVIRTPIQAPNANAHAERWVRTLRAECVDRIVILGRRHLEHMLRVYRRHYNGLRPQVRPSRPVRGSGRVEASFAPVLATQRSVPSPAPCRALRGRRGMPRAPLPAGHSDTEKASTARANALATDAPFIDSIAARIGR